jgi:hypothetical protein
MKPFEFISEVKTYSAFYFAKKAADKLGHKVVKSPAGYYTTAQLDDPRPAVMINPDREDIEPRLKAELEKLIKQKKEFLALQLKVSSGFLQGKEYEDQITREKWREIKDNIKGVRRQLKFLPHKYIAEQSIQEQSPDTLEGSFTVDLVDSKMWLCQKLAKLLKGKSAGRIYALGSWYGNIGIFLQQAGIKFDDLVLVETDEKLLNASEKLLQPLYDEGRIILLHQDAKDVVYEKPATVINCSTNDMDTNWLDAVPNNILVAMQGRNNVEDVPTRTSTLEEFDELFPLRKVVYLNKISLEDPEVKYQRYMKIGFK